MIKILKTDHIQKTKSALGKHQYIRFVLGECQFCKETRIYRESNAKTQKSCGCVTTKPVFKGADACKKHFYNSLKNNCRVRKHEPPTLTLEEVVVLAESNCFYCGMEPRIKHHNKTTRLGVYRPWVRNSIDRLDSKQGYTIANSVPCCKLCNLMKNTLSVTEFVEHIQRIGKFLEALS